MCSITSHDVLYNITYHVLYNPNPNPNIKHHVLYNPNITCVI